jgi:hypothetical protein
LQRILVGPDRPYIEGDYPSKPADEDLGLLSYRFLRLFTDFRAWAERRPTIKSQEDSRQFYEDHGICSNFICTERLEQDLAILLIDLGSEATAASLRPDKIPVTKHGPYGEYYNDHLTAMDREHDGLIGDHFTNDYPESEPH